MEKNIEIPDGMEVTVERNRVEVKGEKGVVSRKFPRVKITKKDNELILSLDSDKRRARALLGTTSAHIQNMIHGVKDGIVYNLRIVYSHFPMSVKVQGDWVVISNFFGERCPRKSRIIEDADVKINGREVCVTGVNKENVAQTAANMEQATRVKGRDPRVFQDGIYIIEKDGKSMLK